MVPKTAKNAILPLFFASLFFSSAAAEGKVFINEVAWMGSSDSAAAEWIELHNGGSAPADLSGWTLETESGGLKIALRGEIGAGKFFLLERSSDRSAPGRKADQIYRGSLRNSGEAIRLYDSSGSQVDYLPFSAGGPAGGNKTKQTMEKDGGEWKTSESPGGTPGAENSRAAGRGGGKKRPYAAAVHINEIMPAPKGPDKEKEWIELHNGGSAPADLSGWALSDRSGSRLSSYEFPPGAKISAAGYLLLHRPESGIVLNDAGDALELARPDGKTADSVSYGRAEPGKSYARKKSGWAWSDLPTPGAENSFPAPSAEKKGGADAAKTAFAGKSALAPAKGRPFPARPEKGGLSAAWLALAAAAASGAALALLGKSRRPL